MDDALTVDLPAALVGQADRLAHQLNISRRRVFELALAALEATAYPPASAVPQPADGAREINQGDLFWIRPDGVSAAELGYYPHPYVVVQDDILNRSRIATVVVCALTSNMRQANAPGNVLLDAGEAGLPKRSIVDVAKVSSLRTDQLGSYIGTLSQQRVRQILAGMRFLQRSFFGR